MSIGLTPQAPPCPLEHLLWRCTKDSRIAEARVRVMAHGREFRVTGGDTLIFSRLFRGDEIGEFLGIESTGTLQNFLGHGWTQDLNA